MRAIRRAALGGVAVAAALVAWGEGVNRLAARRDLGDEAAAGRTVVVVLGFRNPGRVINGVNRWRVRAGIATARRLDAEAIVFSGGSPAGRCEADLMADHAHVLGYRGAVVRERASRTTQENIAFSLPHLEGATRIVLVSNPPHAQRARRDLRDRRPDLAARLAPAVDARPGAWIVLLPLAALYELAVRLWLRASRPRG
ncbi:YdcF family protein [Microbacterium betulae]|uniref:YdcF family protein n=1 Tax=Microbacterium betulae TaxID=2981139 RepID=A0AA97FKE1_9MICO|nr:YdcF family protein [Microbacterium sp. AB]WOF24408.1 YdcF family protein [Microbacterium sp. AB]